VEVTGRRPGVVGGPTGIGRMAVTRECRAPAGALALNREIGRIFAPHPEALAPGAVKLVDMIAPSALGMARTLPTAAGCRGVQWRASVDAGAAPG
jgi:hypothetical protein